MKSIVIDRSYFFKNTRYKWRTSAGKEIYVDELKEDHLRNIYKLLCDKDRYFPKVYLGYTRETWRDVLFLELRKRQGFDSKELYKPVKPASKSNVEKVLEDMDRRIKREELRDKIRRSWGNTDDSW